MSPNQQEQKQKQNSKVANVDWELDRLSTTGRHFILEPESRTGIVNDLQLRLQQELRRRHELLLLRSANNSVQNPQLKSEQQMEKEKPIGGDPLVTSVEQRKSGRAPSPPDNEAAVAKVSRRSRVGSTDLVATASTEMVNAPRNSEKTEISADLTTSESSDAEATEKRSTKVNMQSAPSVDQPVQRSIVRSVTGKSAVDYKEEEVAFNETTPTATVSPKLSTIRQTADQTVTANKEDAVTDTKSILNVIRLRKEQMSQPREELSTGFTKMARRNSLRSSNARAGVMNEKGATNSAQASRRNNGPGGLMDSTMGFDELVLKKSFRSTNGTTPGEATPAIVTPIPRRSRLRFTHTMEEVESTSQSTWTNDIRSNNTTATVEEEVAANIVQTAPSRSLRLQNSAPLRMESPMRHASSVEPTSNFQPSHWRPDTRAPNEPSPGADPAGWSLPPHKPMPPCLLCLMRCLLDSGLLGNCWKTAVFELEEAFAIKEVADAAIGKSTTGAGGESRHAAPLLNKIGGGCVYSGGEGSPQSEISKWQALERLCSLRNSLKACSHLTDS